MRIWLPIAMLAVMLTANPLLAKPSRAPVANPFMLDPIFLRPDGAILTWTSGPVIDPYFPTKALMLAQDNGMDISDIGTRWVDWMLAHQNDNGLFGRYCYKEEQNTYDVCGTADADDAMMAMWIELLYRLAPRGGLPNTWFESAQKAQYQLDSIFDAKAGVFLISKAMPVGLLMDNIEIYAAYKSIERNAIRMTDNKVAQEYHARAEYLKNGIIPTFWDTKAHNFKASTQDRTENDFYPDSVAQLIPIMYGFSSPAIKLPANFYAKWMKDHRDEWFALIGKDYPWGLLAAFAMQHGDLMTANCWLQQSTPFRYVTQWNILDEAAFQSINWKLRRKWPTELPTCTITSEKAPPEKKGGKVA